ncbi:MAG: hypothetical protein V3U14_12875 [candidate division NC10 bacterium]
MTLTSPRLEQTTDVIRAIWDPTEGFHSRHGERSLLDIDRVEVHWTGTGGDMLDHFDTAEELLSFERYHELTKKWYDLFYNWGLDSEGFIYEGRDMTIPSQSSLRSVATLLVVMGPDEMLMPGTPAYDAIAFGIWRAWGAVDPSRSSRSLGWHQERSSTSCPGPDIINLIKRLLGGWIPEGTQMTNELVPEDLSNHADAQGSKALGFISGEGARVASRSVVAVVAYRVYSLLNKRIAAISAEPGPQGRRGATGLQGFKGDRGLQGPPGRQGAPGTANIDDLADAVVAKLLERFKQ